MLNQIAFLDLSTPDLIIILVIVLLLFGGRKLPELSKALGDSVRELRKGINNGSGNEKAKKQNTSNSDENKES